MSLSHESELINEGVPSVMLLFTLMSSIASEPGGQQGYRNKNLCADAIFMHIYLFFKPQVYVHFHYVPVMTIKTLDSLP